MWRCRVGSRVALGSCSGQSTGGSNVHVKSGSHVSHCANPANGSIRRGKNFGQGVHDLIFFTI